MLSLVRVLPIRHLRRKPLRPALTVLGVALGIALFVAIDLINSATLGFFRETVYAVTGKASLSVVGGESGLPEDKLDVVKRVPGVKTAVPLVEARAIYTAANGRKQTLVIFGIDFLVESAVRSYKNAKDENVLDDPLVFLNQPDSLVVTQAFASVNGLSSDSRIDLMTAFGNKPFTVRGILTPAGTAKAFGGDLAIMDIDGARVMFGKEGRTDRIDVVPAAGANVAELSTAIEAALGPGYRVERPENQTEAFERMIAGYQGFLAFLSSLAFLVGYFLLVNAIAMSVAERRTEIGVLRALGASRLTLVTVLVFEAMVMGVAGAAIGLAVGRGTASLLVELVARSMRVQYSTPIAVSALELGAPLVVRALLLGAIAAAVAAAWPAYKATRVPTSRAIGGKGPSDARARAYRWRLVGLAMLAYLPFSAKVTERIPALASLGALCAVAGVVLTAPLFIAGVLGLVRGALLWKGGPLERASVLRLACENLLRDPKRTGSHVTSLMVALMLVIVMATIHRSFSDSLDGWLKRTLQADLMISSSGRVVALQVQPLHEDLGKELDHVPGVSVAGGSGARGFRYVQVPYGGASVMLKALDEPHPLMGYSVFDVVEGSSSDAGRALYAPGAHRTIVSQAFTAHFGKKVGDSLELVTPGGPLSLEIVATVVDFGAPSGVFYVPRELYKQYWKDPLVTGFVIQVNPGVSPAVVRDEISARFSGVVALQSAEIRSQMADVLDESFAYTHAMELAALVVGLLGLFNTALASALDRVSELGMLRAIGMSRSQLVRMTLGEAALLGAAGGVTASILGAYVSYWWVMTTLTRALGWIISVHVPLDASLLTVGLGLAVGGSAGLLVAVKTSRIQIREALSHE